jgi:hypothetical protein
MVRQLYPHFLQLAELTTACGNGGGSYGDESANKRPRSFKNDSSGCYKCGENGHFSSGEQQLVL